MMFALFSLLLAKECMFSIFSQTCQFLDDATYGIECIFFPESLNYAFSSEMGLLENCHSSMRHPVG